MRVIVLRSLQTLLLINVLASTLVACLKLLADLRGLAIKSGQLLKRAVVAICSTARGHHTRAATEGHKVIVVVAIFSLNVAVTAFKAICGASTVMITEAMLHAKSLSIAQLVV